MKNARTLLSIVALGATTLAAPTWAATDGQHDGHHPDKSPAVQVAQAMPAKSGMGMGMNAGAAMPGYSEQMQAMSEMHDKMMAAKTPEARNALMAEQMKLMHNGMSMMQGMSGMGTGAMMGGKTGDMAAGQSMMEQRMDMMQSMMQMMIDRMQSGAATK